MFICYERLTFFAVELSESVACIVSQREQKYSSTCSHEVESYVACTNLTSSHPDSFFCTHGHRGPWSPPPCSDRIQGSVCCHTGRHSVLHTRIHTDCHYNNNNIRVPSSTLCRIEATQGENAGLSSNMQ